MEDSDFRAVAAVRSLAGDQSGSPVLEDDEVLGRTTGSPDPSHLAPLATGFVVIGATAGERSVGRQVPCPDLDAADVAVAVGWSDRWIPVSLVTASRGRDDRILAAISSMYPCGLNGSLMVPFGWVEAAP